MIILKEKTRYCEIENHFPNLTCVPDPQSADEFFIRIQKWMRFYCKGNKCAAFLLSNFIIWQNWKIRTDAYNKHLNDIAEQHGEARRFCEDVWLFKSYEGLAESILNFFNVKTIKVALHLLQSLDCLSIHKTPNKNHYYDKRNYFRFYPEVVIEWLKNEYPKIKNTNLEDGVNEEEKLPDALVNFSKTNENLDKETQKTSQPIESTEYVKLPNALGNNGGSTGKSGDSINYKHIINYENNQSINAHDENFSFQSDLDFEVKLITDALLKKGIQPHQFYPDTICTISVLQKLGATPELYSEAYDKAEHATCGRGFGVKYVNEVVRRKLVKEKKISAKMLHESPQQHVSNSNQRSETKKVYEENLTNAQSWAGDLI